MSPPQTPSPFRRSQIVYLQDLFSSYPTDAPYHKRDDIAARPYTAWATSDASNVLHAAQQAVEQAGGTLSITEVGRYFSLSAKARLAYLSGEKRAYVSPAGESMHNAGRAVDINAYDLGGLSLADVWDIVIPLGLTPIIMRPDTRLDECWHFDIRTPWLDDTFRWFKQRARSGAYGMMARCAILDAGCWDLEFDTEHDAGWVQCAYVQASLHRVGLHEVGPVDGVYGDMTTNALAMVPGALMVNVVGQAEILNGFASGYWKWTP